MQDRSASKAEAIVGCILGTAVGDAMGLPFEGLSRSRQLKLCPRLDGCRFVFGKGMTSDDTEHTCLLAQSLIVSAGQTDRFVSDFSRRLRFWLLGLPAGVGLATLKSVIKLWLSYSGADSGVRSAGNGPAMRSALIGVCFGHEPDRMRALVGASTRITHTDERAEVGALAVALAAHFSAEHEVSSRDYIAALQAMLGPRDGEFLDLIERAAASAAAGESSADFARKIGCPHGVSGYIYHTVPVVLQTWMRHRDHYAQGIAEIIRCGGDTDTTAAILGAIVGAGVGRDGIPESWLDGIREWPRTIPWMERLGRRLAEVCADREARQALPLSVSGLFLRNFVFLLLVLAHGFRRVLPPY